MTELFFEWERERSKFLKKRKSEISNAQTIVIAIARDAIVDLR